MRFSIGGVVFEVKNADQQILNELQVFNSTQPYEYLIDLNNSQVKGVDDFTAKRHYLYTETTKYLFTKGVVRIHSSAVEYKGKAYAFGAPSGTGKSTHARLWNGFVGAKYINDETYADKWLVKIETTADQVEFADLLDYSDYIEEVQ